MTLTAISPRLAMRTLLSTAGQSVRVIVEERVRRRLQSASRFGDIRAFPEIDSTNRWLLDRAAEGAGEGMVAVTDHQVEGRGRRGRRWEAPPGTALLVSVLLRPEISPERWHLVNSAVALSARQAVLEVAGFAPDLKWPNDLLVGDRKLAGVLAEAAGAALVVGLGCNVSWAPQGAVSAEEAAGRPVDRQAILEALLLELEGWYGRWDAVPAAYRPACATIGRRVRVEAPGGPLEGTATGVDGDGRLLLRRPGGEEVALAAGDVVHLRLASGA
jgi:BirA family biotin operon repressor/biotin-[acetyl-CoA-carboxylase] ligase